MKFNPDQHHRQTIRLKGYDYSQAGYYYVTICTNNRECLFGEITDSGMNLNEFGRIVERCWADIPNHYPSVSLDNYVIMPNHIHGILIINNNKVNNNPNVGIQNFESLQQGFMRYGKINKYQKIIPRSLGSIIRGFKTGVTKWFRENTDIYIIWQRNYYERVLRDEKELETIRQYIMDNPFRWSEDENNPANIKERNKN